MNYHSLNQFCRAEFGKKLYKLSLDGGMTCPNRDGTVSTGGCIFCSAEGSGEFAEKCENDIFTQIEKAKERVCHKNKDGKYIAYFQSFTNTYAPVPYLEKIFSEAVSHPDIEVLSVATRPDCLGVDVLRLLEKINKVKPVWVELGLQTANEESALYINRGYKNNVFQEAVKNLNSIDIKSVAHIILGLPHEEFSDMENSVCFAVDAGIWGLKLHLLHVLEGTKLAEAYKNGEFSCLTKEAYIQILCRLLPVIPQDVVIHRLTGDGDKKTLLAPLWSGNKKDVLNSINKAFSQQKITQGSMVI